MLCSRSYSKKNKLIQYKLYRHKKFYHLLKNIPFFLLILWVLLLHNFQVDYYVVVAIYCF